ncbi:MAG: hypothetical protein A2406_03490 [Candidatus Komeilibacteria bacterium RIFOXYC1_FULL_37_11]|uniref:Methyltransferase domain-containing protein n=1 Tax=Candidatus Komeilibacteria bacterium RIFOXYC1_FULL_37_11 TaxID=1798555 RepID=A0A1G2BYB9_9BACT|nr:MAG: hypothetical protein A2406_03490 [Candidatus Komeilibacteria bacterium RIFOXYC1_FULL_37_11]OGY95162.1 MAG: hypothetical protein A2611_00430 [Candidatus Komeilibacteria bacterium RIFOXYD1_FULL_37_29]OGY96355.1 MAG: hypothetical protein A2543_01815 [Candidatus Komeilibacteria bacterium RIFOXYD2_FULL_37_8]
MSATKNTKNTADFQIPPATDPANISANQMANQDLGSDQQNNSPSAATNHRQNQTAVFGKSELLNANQILGQILGIKNGQRVADLGAGGGMFTLQSARLVGDQGEVYAVDVVKNCLSDIESKARMANLYNIKTVWSNIEIVGATKIPEESLDFVLLVNVLFQTNKTDQVLKEGKRLLKTGGKMLIIDWSARKGGVGPRNDRHISPETINSQAQKINLIPEQQFKAGQYHFGQIFIKL